MVTLSELDKRLIDKVEGPYRTAGRKVDAVFQGLIDLTVLRASRAGLVAEFLPGEGAMPMGKAASGFQVVSVSVNGLAEAQNECYCDECGECLQRGRAVLGKTVVAAKDGGSWSFFSPTCLGCYAKGVGGYMDFVTALLVMET